MKRKLTSGGATGESCQCGAAIFAYYTSRCYRPDEPLPPIADIPMGWRFVCEAGHWQEEPHLAVNKEPT